MTYLEIKSLCVFVLVCVAAEAFGLTQPDGYHYLRKSSCLPDKTINDNGTFQDVLVRRKQLASSLKNLAAHAFIHAYTAFTHLRFRALFYSSRSVIACFRPKKLNSKSTCAKLIPRHINQLRDYF